MFFKKAENTIYIPFICSLNIWGDETWDRVQKFLAHEEGVNSIVWGPVIETDEINV